MDYIKLAELLFPHIEHTPKYYEKKYPERVQKEGARVTRMAPSPTGFMHLGNLFGAVADERLAKQSGGVLYLRIEDTDKKRQVEDGERMILQVFKQFGIHFDEGVSETGEIGDYGPYRQSERKEIYQTYAKELVRQGRAYPCFCSEEDLADMRKKQEGRKENFGYYGKYAIHRQEDFDEINSKLDKKIPYVIRFKSMGSADNKIVCGDLIKGKLEMPQNEQDVVILKSDGIPTYHFAHVIDDHLMRTSIVVRGEEWLSTLPIHLDLADALKIAPPKYAHTAQLMKMDGGSKRKLSKRKDPELALEFYHSKGYPKESVLEYLMILLNSNFEEWRLKNPLEARDKFPFSLKKMSASGSLFDIAKLNDVSKNTIAYMSAEDVFESLLEWAKVYDEDFYKKLSADRDYAINILKIGRGGKKPRKDIAVFSEAKEYMGFFYDDYFSPALALLKGFDEKDVLTVLSEYYNVYEEEEDANRWFNAVCVLSEKLGFAPSTKDFRENPSLYKGSPGDVSQMIRIAVTGRENSPDLYSVMMILGKSRVRTRLQNACNYLKGGE